MRAPFAYMDRSAWQRRPALVVSDGGIGENGALLWVVMITSADNRMCTGDVAFGADDKSAGLPAPSVLRPLKIATIDVSRAEPVGTASPELVRGVLAKIKQSLRL